MIKDVFKTKANLEEFLESEESEKYRDNQFHYLYLDCDDCNDHFALHPVPYWLHLYCEDDDCMVEYIPGYHENLEIGDESIVDGVKYRYIDSVSLPEEVEYQTLGGECVYEYRGVSFLRVWKKV